MSLVKSEDIENSEKSMVGKLVKKFEYEVDSTLQFKQYSKMKVAEKAKQWNEIAIKFLDSVDNEIHKDELAYKFVMFMINKMEVLSGKQPVLQSEIEERFMRKLTQ